MSSTARMAALIILVAGLAGCGSGDDTSESESTGPPPAAGGSPAALVDDMTATLGDLTAMLDGVTDAESATATAPRLAAGFQKLEQMQAKIQAIPEDQRAAIAEKGVAMMGAMNNFNAKMSQLMQDPAIAEAFQKAQQAVAPGQ